MKKLLYKTALIFTFLFVPSVYACNGKNFNGWTFTANTTGFTNWDFSYDCFENATFSRALMSGANFTGADFKNAIFSGIDFTGVIFTDAILTGADFHNAPEPDPDKPLPAKNINLGNAVFKNANLTDVNFTNDMLTDVNFEGADLTNTDLTNTILIGANLANVKNFNLIKNKDMSYIQADSYIDSKGILHSTNFSNVNLSNLNFYRASLNGDIFDGADFTETNLLGACLYDVDLTTTRNFNLIKGKDLSYVIADHANFSDLNLSGFDFTKASLRGANFKGTNLTGVKFSETIWTDGTTINGVCADGSIGKCIII